jgi:hypothetical protein
MVLLFAGRLESSGGRVLLKSCRNTCRGGDNGDERLSLPCIPNEQKRCCEAANTLSGSGVSRHHAYVEQCHPAVVLSCTTQLIIFVCTSSKEWKIPYRIGECLLWHIDGDIGPQLL